MYLFIVLCYMYLFCRFCYGPFGCSISTLKIIIDLNWVIYRIWNSERKPSFENFSAGFYHIESLRPQGIYSVSRLQRRNGLRRIQAAGVIQRIWLSTCWGTRQNGRLLPCRFVELYCKSDTLWHEAIITYVSSHLYYAIWDWQDTRSTPIAEFYVHVTVHRNKFL